MNPFRHSFRVPFDELDPAGILFFANLLVHTHQAYEEMMLDIGFPLGRILAQEDYLLPLVHAEADYRQPLHLDDRIEVELLVQELGQHSFTLSYRFLRAGFECAVSLTRHAVVDRQNGRPLPLPQDLARALARYRSASA
ncbi:MAG TPA: acyl-CoA thioesterase [Chromatiaceae bacterium]|nr:acyl-CoA thioesterase [Chromatiaceae bacterium]